MPFIVVIERGYINSQPIGVVRVIVVTNIGKQLAAIGCIDIVGTGCPHQQRLLFTILAVREKHLFQVVIEVVNLKIKRQYEGIGVVDIRQFDVVVAIKHQRVRVTVTVQSSGV